MNKMIVAVAALLACTGFASAQKTAPKKLKEPACCVGKKCKHHMGEGKHHTCNKHCHSKAQPKGECCKGYSPNKPKPKPAKK